MTVQPFPEPFGMGACSHLTSPATAGFLMGKKHFTEVQIATAFSAGRVGHFGG